jgi:hypothetical protein
MTAASIAACVAMLFGVALPAAAAPATLGPPVTGTMYNGNNTKAPQLEAATAPSQSIKQDPGGESAQGTEQQNSNGVATGQSAAGSSGGSMSRAGGGN